MESFQIYKNLGWINDLLDDEAETLFRVLGGSESWARRMTKLRPFAMVENLYQAAERTWFALPPGEWIAAFSSLSDAPQKTMRTFAGSASKPRNPEFSPGEAGTELATHASLYKEKFGFIFVVCSSGKSADEVLAICRARIGNSATTELQIAADEYRKIIDIRLNNLLEQ